MRAPARELHGARTAAVVVTAAGLLGLFAGGCATPESQRAAEAAGAEARPSAEVLRDPIWDDGRAEFSVYDGITRLEGRERAFTARVIVVKEDFVRDLLVKSDAGPVAGKTFEVLKLNYLRDVPTGMYDFHQMASVFFERTTFRAVKYAASSMESCGLTFVVAKPEDGRLAHVSHSYWDAEGDRTQTIEWSQNAVFYDGLPLWLRGFDLAEPARREMQVLPTQLQSRVGTPAVEAATLQFEGADETRGGRYAVRMTHGRGEDRLWFEPEAPHVLWRWEKANGTVLELRRTQRVPYWERTAPEDAALVGEPREVRLP